MALRQLRVEPRDLRCGGDMVPLGSAEMVSYVVTCIFVGFIPNYLSANRSHGLAQSRTLAHQPLSIRSQETVVVCLVKVWGG
ncbi:MAG: hypothetical protein RL077_713 [Verrucomicrobiota bacterium]|jgi:hypothetical protein